MNVAYCGPFRDHSGYGEANRHDIAALHTAGVHVMPKLVSYTVDPADFGTLGRMMAELEAQEPIDYRIKILHVTPNEFPRLMERGKYHIGRFFWETDKVPSEFVEGLNLMDEIWTGSKANESAMRKGGVTKPIFIIPQANETDRQWPEPYKIPGLADGAYLFYSIFEWTDRKNPLGLLNAYLKEFQAGENVGLLIKTYFRNFTYANKHMIRDAVQKVRDTSGVKNPPPIFLYQELMDREHIMRLHKTGNAFVSAHRGEGWGVPQVEAMLAGNPVITTGYGGVHEYLTDQANAFVLPYEMQPLKGMYHSSRWYEPDQNWADPSEKALRDAMRFCYSQPKAAQVIGNAGKANAVIRFNFEAVGDAMKQRLKEIQDTL